MIANENILISDKLMKLEVENKELFCNYYKLRRAFNELIEVHDEILSKTGRVPMDRYEWCNKAGMLDDAE